MSPVDRLALEGRISNLITTENVNRLAGVLGGINPGIGILAGIIGAVLVRATQKVNDYVAQQWNAPLVPPDILIPMDYDQALRFLKMKGLTESFDEEIQRVDSESDLWAKRQKQDVVGSIATFMNLVLEGKSRGSLVSLFFRHLVKEGKYREIWDQRDRYMQAQQELITMLPIVEVKGLLSIAFGNDPLSGSISAIAISDAAKSLREAITIHINKLGLDVDLDALLSSLG